MALRSCEACGDDGLIEIGAYRGDDGSDTRECRLCGGYPRGAGIVEFHVSESGKRSVAREAVARLGSTLGTAQDQQQQRAVAMEIAREAAIRRREQYERQRQERLANPAILQDTGQMSGDELGYALQRAAKIRAKWNK